MFSCRAYTPQKAVIPENKRLGHLHAQIALPSLLRPRAITDPAHPSAVGRDPVRERWNRTTVVALGEEWQQQAGLWETKGVAFAGI